MALLRQNRISEPGRILGVMLAGAVIAALLLAAGCAPASPSESTDTKPEPSAGSPAIPAGSSVENTDRNGAGGGVDAGPSTPAVAETAPLNQPALPSTEATVEAAAGKEDGDLEAATTETSAAPAEKGPVSPATVAPEGSADQEAEGETAQGPLAAEVQGIAGWINSDPLTLEQLRGKVVLIDFWTYTCVNCIRTFPYLKLWHSRYADDGLVILGVHTPEFEFEKDFDNVEQATRDNGIVWPVAQDNEFETWRAYKNRFWPAKYLIDHDGAIRYTHFGEGEYAETERRIRELLAEAGADLSDDVELPEDQQLDPAFLSTLDAEITPELYAGYQRNFNAIMSGFRPYVIQTAYYENPDAIVNLAAPERPEPHHIYFNGSWLVGAEHTQHARTAPDYADYIALNYSARSVNAVLTSGGGGEYRVRVTLDGQYLTEENRGGDIHIGEDGESYLVVKEPRLYEIVDSPAYTQGKVLRLSSKSADFGIYAFTFGIYREGP